MRVFILIISVFLVLFTAGLILHFTASDFEVEQALEDKQVKMRTSETSKSQTQSLEISKQQEKLADETKDKADTETPNWLKEPGTKKSPQQSSNPWKDFEFTDPLLDNEIETAEIDIVDPSSYDALRKEMIINYGETTEVENYMQSWLKAVSNPQNMAYKAEFTKAVYELSPSPETKKSMEIFNAIVNNDLETLQRYSEPAQEDTRFRDVQRFFEGKSNHVDAFRRLREFNPKRSVEFEKFILEQARKDPHMDFEKISRDILESYK